MTWVPQSRLAFGHSARRLAIGPPALAKLNPTVCSLACRWRLRSALRADRESFSIESGPLLDSKALLYSSKLSYSCIDNHLCLLYLCYSCSSCFSFSCFQLFSLFAPPVSVPPVPVSLLLSPIGTSFTLLLPLNSIQPQTGVSVPHAVRAVHPHKAAQETQEEV